MNNIAYYNGTIAPIDEIMVPMNDRACWFGDGVYEATCTRRHNPFALDDHIRRFFNSCDMLKIPHPMEWEAFSKKVSPVFFMVSIISLSFDLSSI